MVVSLALFMPLIIILIALLVAAIPLTIAVKLMGGDASLFKVVMVNILVAVVTFTIQRFVPGIGAFATFFVMILIYKSMFGLGWLKTIFAWLLQGVVVVVLVLVLGLLGLTVALW